MLTKLPHQRLSQLAAGVLLVYIVYLLAQTTWLLWPEPNANARNPSTSSSMASPSASKNYDINAIKGLNLFGQAESTERKVVVEEVTNAPETRLNLILSGVVASDNPLKSAAIVEYQGKQATYGLGENITGTRASLEKVLSDRVLIRHAGRVETLMLDGHKFNNQSNTSGSKPASQRPQSSQLAKAAAVIDQRGNVAARSSLAQLKNAVSSDMGKITDYLRISPVRKAGKIAGYRLMPGKDPALFKASGLQSGDMAVQINGVDLSDPREAGDALRELRTAQDVSLLVERKGELNEILFSLTNK